MDAYVLRSERRLPVQQEVLIVLRDSDRQLMFGILLFCCVIFASWWICCLSAERSCTDSAPCVYSSPAENSPRPPPRDAGGTHTFHTHTRSVCACGSLASEDDVIFLFHPSIHACSQTGLRGRHSPRINCLSAAFDLRLQSFTQNSSSAAAGLRGALRLFTHY